MVSLTVDGMMIQVYNLCCSKRVVKAGAIAKNNKARTANRSPSIIVVYTID
jgi:hypothetical protein